jgi:uroporphyrinogen decarboxylase
MGHRRSELSSRERVRLALAHRDTDRVPLAMVCAGINPPLWGQVDAFLRRERGQDLPAFLDSVLDIRAVGPVYIGPPPAPGTDMWGVHRSTAAHANGGAYEEIDHYPLAAVESIDDLLRHRWPQPDWFDYSTLPDQITRVNEQGGPYAVMALNCNVFETSWYMRGFEQAFIDLATGSEVMAWILGTVTDFYCEYARRTLEAAGGGIDLVFTADDIGGQNGLLMGLGMWEQTLKPCHERVNRVIHEYGAKVMYHSDGSVTDAVPGLLDMGIDVLQALQFDAEGMDPRFLKESYGDRLCFEGGVSVQQTLPFGTADQVREEVRELVRVLGRNGGYILGPSHVIQAGTPVANVLAMFDAALGRDPERR